MKTFTRIVSNLAATIITDENGATAIRLNDDIELWHDNTKSFNEYSTKSVEECEELLKLNDFKHEYQQLNLQQIVHSVKVAKEIEAYSDAHPNETMYVNYHTSFRHNNAGHDEICEIIIFR